MQLTGSMVWGPPRDRAGADQRPPRGRPSWVNHIDTSDYYGPHIANEIIREALHPYPKELVIVTKVGRSDGLPTNHGQRRCQKRKSSAQFTIIFAILASMFWTLSIFVLTTPV